MTQEIVLLSLTAASLGFVHTLLGPDHYLPFIVLGKARNWTIRKTMGITFLSGLGHVLSSVVIGAIGILLGISIHKLTGIESSRGSLVGWLLIAFGLAYAIYGYRKMIKGHTHQHTHTHSNGLSHDHEHDHHTEHSHVHQSEKKKLTPWILFLIFVFGPCEPLIPILMYPASQNSTMGVVTVSSVFAIATIGTMMSTVYLGNKGIQLLPVKKIEKYMHILAGLIILVSGLGMTFLGL